MKRSELLPTHNNLINTYCNDSIGRNEEIYHFVRIINSIDGSYSVALNGNWGSGKTFFVKQTQMIFDTYNPFTQMESELDGESKQKVKSVWEKLCKKNNSEVWEPMNHVCVYYDAWEHDTDDNPIASLVYQITKTATEEYKFAGKRNLLDAAIGIIDLLTGKDIKEIISALKEINITDEPKEKDKLRSKIDTYFSELLPEHGDRLIIFIDELDRCNPRYAVDLLEKIKHYFTNEKITFVFSVNMEQLQYTIQQFYGSNFNAYKYLDRFFDLTIPMPKVNWMKFYDVNDYNTSEYIYQQVADSVIKAMSFEMREASRYLSTLKMITDSKSHEIHSTPDKTFCLCFLVPIAVGLYKSDISKYNDFISGKDPSMLINILCLDDFKDVAIELLVAERNNNYSIEQKIEEAYKAIFIDARNRQGITVGNANFRPATLQYFEKTVSILTGITNIE